MKKWLVILTIFFISCTNPQPPKWYINTPSDTPNFFYASAEGYTKENAIKNALNDIASRINVKISSNFIINKGIHNQKTYNEIYQQINTQVNDINFNNYEILKTKKEDDKYYVLLRVNKQKLIQNLKTKIQISFTNINFNNQNQINSVIYAYKILHRLKKLKSEIFILESLGLNISNYIDKLKNIETKAMNIILNTPFKIKTNMFKNQTIEAFSKYIVISENSANVIKIKIDIQKYYLFENFIIKGKALIYIDRPYTVTFLGQSVSSYKEAEAFAKEEYKLRLLKLLHKIFKFSVF